MFNRFALGVIILCVVVSVACLGCSDRNRSNCTRIKNKALAVENTANAGGGRCG